MPTIKIKNPDGTWKYVNEPSSNADTLDGKHADEFALKTEIPDQIYIQNEAPTDIEEGALWLDLDNNDKNNNALAGLNRKVDKETLVAFLLGILRAGNYKSDQTMNIDALEAALNGTGIIQDGNMLRIYNNISAVQNESVLEIS